MIKIGIVANDLQLRESWGERSGRESANDLQSERLVDAQDMQGSDSGLRVPDVSPDARTCGMTRERQGNQAAAAGS